MIRTRGNFIYRCYLDLIDILDETDARKMNIADIVIFLCRLRTLYYTYKNNNLSLQRSIL